MDCFFVVLKCRVCEIFRTFRFSRFLHVSFFKSSTFRFAGFMWNTVNSREKVNINLLQDDDIQTIDVDGKKIIAINVPHADYTVRPVYINNNLSRGTFKRNHEGDYHCTEQELKMMLRDANEAGNDGLLLEYYTMDDIDIATLERFRQMFQNLHPEHQWNSAENKEFLTNFGGYTRDRRTGKEGLTMAGLLMFGKGLTVRERFDNLRMDYIDKSNLIGDQRYSDRLTYDGTWENNLFNFIRMAIPKLTRDLPHPFSMDGVVRKDDTLQPKSVIRISLCRTAKRNPLIFPI